MIVCTTHPTTWEANQKYFHQCVDLPAPLTPQDHKLFPGVIVVNVTLSKPSAIFVWFFEDCFSSYFICFSFENKVSNVAYMRNIKKPPSHFFFSFLWYKKINLKRNISVFWIKNTKLSSLNEMYMFLFNSLILCSHTLQIRLVLPHRLSTR